jgi:hypothetical protein
VHTRADVARVLFRHFLRRFYDNDLLSPQNDQHGLLARTIALLMVPGLLYPGLLLVKYTYPFPTFARLEHASWSDKTLLITMTMAVMGLVAALEWDVLHIDRRDSLSLGVLPIEPARLLWAKMKALGAVFVTLAAAMTCLGALTFPMIMYARWPAGPITVLRAVGAQAVATMCGAACVFFALLALHGALSLAMSPRRFARVSSWIQMIITFVLVVTILLLPLLAGSIYQLRESGGGWWWVPFLWYVGLDEWLAGHGDPVWATLAWRGCWVLGVVVLLAMVANLMGFRRRLRRMLESTGTAVAGSSPTRRMLTGLGAVLLPGSSARGFFHFSLATFSRCSRHRMIVAACFGGAVALGGVGLATATYESATEWHRPVPSALLAVELTFASVALAGARVAAASPSELRANWVFRLLDPGRVAPWLSGFRRAVWIWPILPIIVAVGSLAVLILGWPVGATHALTCLVWCGTVLELLFIEFGRIPFAAPVGDGGGSVQSRWFILGIGLASAVSPVAWLVTYASGSVAGVVTMSVLGLGAWIGAWWWNRRTMPVSPGAAFLADDGSAQTLGLDR